jgi:drug/metabolite transporter (DMT)-like permease
MLLSTVSWFWLSLGAGLFSVVFGTVNRFYLRNGTDSTAYGWWFEFYRVVAFSVLMLFDYRMVWSWYNIGILLVLGLTELSAVYLFMKMHARTNLSISAVTMQFRLFVVPLAAYLILGEVLPLIVYGGFILLIMGILLTVSFKDIKNPALGIKYGLLFAIPSAMSSILIKMATPFASVPVISFVYGMIPVLLLPVLMKNPISRIRNSVKMYKGGSFLATAANIGTLLLLGYAYKVGTVSQINGVFASMFVVTVLVGMVYLKERLTIKQVFGVFLVLASLVFIS